MLYKKVFAELFEPKAWLQNGTHF